MKELDFEAIYARYHQRLYRFCLSIVGNAEDARDALQNTMVKALRSLPGEQRKIELKPWLYRVAHNESIELLRKRREQVELDSELVAGGRGPAEVAAQRERLRNLLADLAELPERQRAALVMREMGGLEFTEIGEAFDTSDAVARQTVYEARLSLRQLEAGREMSCERVQRQLSEEDGRVTRRRDIQAHLRDCAECREFGSAIAERRHDLAALAPLPAVASAGLLHAVLGGQSAAGAGGLGGTIGAGAGKVVASSALVKSVATAAIVAAIAVPAADRGGLIDLGSGGGGSAAPSQPAAHFDQGATQAGAPGGRTTAAGGNEAGAPSDHGAGGSDAGTGRAGKGSPGEVTPLSKTTGAAGTTNPTHGLPAASNHGQETAASHGGGRESAGSKGEAHSHAPTKPPTHEPSQPNPPARGGPSEEKPPAHPSPVQPADVAPDKGGEPPFQPSQPPADHDASGEPGAQRSKEAR